MTRIIFNSEDKNTDISKKRIVAAGFMSDRDILKKRSKNYLDLVSGIDAKTLTDTKGLDKLIKAIQIEFGLAELSNLPLGIVSKCFLGHPYEVHILDLSGTQVVEHYKTGEPMPPDFEKARILAKHNAYAMVEVYRDKMILISEDGSAIKL